MLENWGNFVISCPEIKKTNKKRIEECRNSFKKPKKAETIKSEQSKIVQKNLDLGRKGLKFQNHLQKNFLKQLKIDGYRFGWVGLDLVFKT